MDGIGSNFHALTTRDDVFREDALRGADRTNSTAKARTVAKTAALWAHQSPHALPTRTAHRREEPCVPVPRQHKPRIPASQYRAAVAIHSIWSRAGRLAECVSIIVVRSAHEAECRPDAETSLAYAMRVPAATPRGHSSRMDHRQTTRADAPSTSTWFPRSGGWRRTSAIGVKYTPDVRSSAPRQPIAGHGKLSCPRQTCRLAVKDQVAWGLRNFLKGLRGQTDAARSAVRDPRVRLRTAAGFARGTKSLPNGTAKYRLSAPCSPARQRPWTPPTWTFTDRPVGNEVLAAHRVLRSKHRVRVSRLTSEDQMRTAGWTRCQRAVD